MPTAIMIEINPEDLFDNIDQQVGKLLLEAGFEEPPVDALGIVQKVFQYQVREADEDDESAATFPPRSRRPIRSRRELILRLDQSPETQHLLAARACARELLPALLERLGIVPGTEQKSTMNSLINLIVPRLLLPSRCFSRDAGKSGYDLWALKERYSTVGYELIALRMLDVDDEPAVISIIDDGVVAVRRGNQSNPGKKLTEAESRCCERVQDQGQPEIVRYREWTVQGWPIPDGPFNRIILRAVPDPI